MPEQPIGSCSICGGEVVGWVGAYHSIVPPPPARCTSCGAVEQRMPVIPMLPTIPMRRVHGNPVRRTFSDYTGDHTSRTADELC